MWRKGSAAGSAVNGVKQAFLCAVLAPSAAVAVSVTPPTKIYSLLLLLDVQFCILSRFTALSCL